MTETPETPETSGNGKDEEFRGKWPLPDGARPARDPETSPEDSPDPSFPASDPPSTAPTGTAPGKGR